MSVANSKYFKKSELRCRCGCDEALMDRSFMMRMDTLRERYGRPIYLNSAYRCPEHNNNVSGTGLDGPHTTGKSVDIRVYGEDAHRMLLYIVELGFTGIGVGQQGEHKKRFLHIDDLEEGTRPWVWSY